MPPSDSRLPPTTQLCERDCTTSLSRSQQSSQGDMQESDRRFGQWVNSSNDFFIVRQHGELNRRVLLMYQSRLHRLEKALQDMDDAFARQCGDTYQHRFLADAASPREQLLVEIAHVCKDYNDHLLSYKAVQDQTPASSRQIRNVLNWFNSNANGCPEDVFFQHNKNDMVSFEDRPRPAIQEFAERWLDGIFATNASTSETRRYDQNKIIRITFIMSVTVGSILLIAPMWAIFYINVLSARLAFITGDAALAWVLLCSGTTWRPGKIMAVCAAYLAILLLALIAAIFNDMQHDSARNFVR